MLLGAIPLISLSVWGQMPSPAEVVILTTETPPTIRVQPVVTAKPQPATVSDPSPAPELAKASAPAPRQIQVYKSVQKNGVTRYSDMMPEQGHYELLLFNDCYACDPASRVNWRTTGLFLYDYASTIKAAAKTYSVDPALIRALIHAESAFNPLAVSRKGAMGLTQLMPATARELGVGNALLAEQNIFGGVKYLAGLLKQYDGNISLATAAYNAGAGAVQKHGGIPPYAETRAYVERVKLLHQRYRDMLSARGL
ncbi:transglycosylase SLT domain-containing protein [Aeromonas sp. MR16]|uniref:lytic transglycosylase domain-containing protein n=1 Tax=Aeromonas sp. MR16 TaxID=2923420 RepID=UPI001F4B6662|nr:transglycosylase SLT domain-containing protein [Aeromonas sp. MR16]